MADPDGAGPVRGRHPRAEDDRVMAAHAYTVPEPPAPMVALRRPWRTNRSLTLVGAAMLVIPAATLVGLVVDDRVITGAPAWLQPATFAVSIVISSFTRLWLLPFVAGHRRARLPRPGPPLDLAGASRPAADRAGRVDARGAGGAPGRLRRARHVQWQRGGIDPRRGRAGVPRRRRPPEALNGVVIVPRNARHGPEPDDERQCAALDRQLDREDIIAKAQDFIAVLHEGMAILTFICFSWLARYWECWPAWLRLRSRRSALYGCTSQSGQSTRGNRCAATHHRAHTGLLDQRWQG